MSDFTPIPGYSRNRTSTVFTDGTNQQRAEFTYNMGSDWTPQSFDKDRTSVLLVNGSDEQRAVVVYNLGEGSDSHNMGWFADESTLSTAHPTAEDGDYAIVGTTDTIWVWDSDNNEWVDTDRKGQVESVNNMTGQVTLTASDVGAQAIITKTTVSETSTTITLTDNTIYNCGTMSSITFTNPTNPQTDFSCQVNFTSGSTATIIALSTGTEIIWLGDNVNENTRFMPRANCRYIIMFTYDGSNIRGIVQGISIA